MSIFGVILVCIQSKCRKIGTGITPNTDTSHADALTQHLVYWDELVLPASSENMRIFICICICMYLYVYVFIYLFIYCFIYLFIYLFIYIFTHSFFTFPYFRQIRTKDKQILDHYQIFLPLQKIFEHYRTYLHVKTKFVKQVQLNAWKHLLV